MDRPAHAESVSMVTHPHSISRRLIGVAVLCARVILLVTFVVLGRCSFQWILALVSDQGQEQTVAGSPKEAKDVTMSTVVIFLLTMGPWYAGPPSSTGGMWTPREFRKHFIPTAVFVALSTIIHAYILDIDMSRRSFQTHHIVYVVTLLIVTLLWQVLDNLVLDFVSRSSFLGSSQPNLTAAMNNLISDMCDVMCILTPDLCFHKPSEELRVFFSELSRHGLDITLRGRSILEFITLASDRKRVLDLLSPGASSSGTTECPRVQMSPMHAKDIVYVNIFHTLLKSSGSSERKHVIGFRISEVLDGFKVDNTAQSQSSSPGLALGLISSLQGGRLAGSQDFSTASDTTRLDLARAAGDSPSTHAMRRRRTEYLSAEALAKASLNPTSLRDMTLQNTIDEPRQDDEDDSHSSVSTVYPDDSASAVCG